jgi:hypothetical protein
MIFWAMMKLEAAGGLAMEFRVPMMLRNLLGVLVFAAAVSK